MSKNTLSGAALMLGACALLAVVAGASTGVTQNTNSGGTGNANSGGAGAGGHAGHGAAQTSADAKFVMEAAMGGVAEVELGRLASQKGASDEVRQFGRRMVEDHTRANEELMQVASSKGMTPPAALDAKHQREMQKLSALSGEKFDREYVKMMLKDHRKDVGEFQRESERGTDADIKSFAARTLPTLQEHLRMIQRISDKMVLRRSGNLKSANPGAGGGAGTNGNTSGNANTGPNANNSNR